MTHERPDGGPEGYAFRSILPRSLNARCGIRNGDIWVSLNGKKLVSPEQVGEEIIPLFRSAPTLVFGLWRKGREVTVRMDVE